MILSSLASAAVDATSALRWENLGLDPVVFEIGFFKLRWYSLAYLAGIILGWWYLLKLLEKPGAPMARRHADDLVFYATLGILLGGRLGYVFFYRPDYYLAHPGDVIRLITAGLVLGAALLVSLVTAAFAWRRRQTPPVQASAESQRPLDRTGV